MKYTRTRELTINVAKYELVKVSATVEYESSDVPRDQTPGEFGDEALNDLLEGEIEEAVKASTNHDTAFQYYREPEA